MSHAAAARRARENGLHSHDAIYRYLLSSGGPTLTLQTGTCRRSSQNGVGFMPAAVLATGDESRLPLPWFPMIDLIPVLQDPLMSPLYMTRNHMASPRVCLSLDPGPNVQSSLSSATASGGVHPFVRPCRCSQGTRLFLAAPRLVEGPYALHVSRLP